MFQLLLVDDEANVVDSLAETLPWGSIGISKVFKAYSGSEALEILGTNTIDILMSDIRMPGMNGLELLAQVRRKWKKVKFILLSGHAEFTYAQEAIGHGLFGYLLKPVSDEDVLAKVGSAVEALRKERDENLSYQRVVQAFQESLPKLRSELLSDLLQGYKFAPGRLREKMDSLKITADDGEPCALMLVRLEGEWLQLDFYNLSLIEYAICNIAEELLEDGFRLWSCKDLYGYLAFIVTAAPVTGDAQRPDDTPADDAADRLQAAAAQLQISVSHYLKGTVSVLISRWGQFPQDVKPLYEESLLTLRRRVGSSSGLFISNTQGIEPMQVHAVQRLYEPPMLVHLLESGNWEAAEEKLKAIWEEPCRKWADSHEHLLEVYFFVYASFSSFAHKNGRELANMIGSALSDAAGLAPCRSAESLQSWILRSFGELRQSMENETRNDREEAISRIQAYVQRHLAEDVSLQTIADYMYMHPVHVSRLYKLETGENMSDYILRLKMESAAAMLADQTLKIYEVSLRLGYQNPNYFNKVFKKYYALTPQEYRQGLQPNEQA
ncbi:response regulator [Paenibacillus sp. GCM10023248]|uniref:response regulator transcription factor n=1 Tax=Bacillales TaxID=1385 RepID=UPI002379591B|nr:MULTISPECIES: response regulator [Bacillales]MDD9267133.1 response regulator [Paenibacillus sp. MAHUQ-63]MDR6881353.1 two-component system response regulator YesN [Bacillus sp. 3255]